MTKRLLSWWKATCRGRSFCRSEKAFAYKMRLEAMKRQGQRTDLTSAPVVQKLTSREKIRQKTDDSHEQVRRFIRLTELVPEILQMVDDRQIAFRPAVEISYLTEEQQYTLLGSHELQRRYPRHSHRQSK